MADIVGSDHLTSRIEDLHCYSYDGLARSHLPDLVVFPQNSGQVSEIMKIASAHRIAVTPRGAGTGMTGGNAAECAGGPSAVKYGVTKDYIIGLEVVLHYELDEEIITLMKRIKGLLDPNHILNPEKIFPT